MHGTTLNAYLQLFNYICCPHPLESLERDRGKGRKMKDLESYSQDEVIFYFNLVLNVVVSMLSLCFLVVLAY
jgi:hypothetical protein